MDPTELMVRALQGVPEDVGDPNLQWRDPVPATAGLVKGLGTGLVDTAKGAIESAGNYAQTGDYDPKPVVNAAMMAAGGAMPGAEAGAAGIFGGRLAMNADLDALKYAQAMRIKGLPRAKIYNETGWLRDPADTKWKFEIPDTQAGLNENILPAKVAQLAGEEDLRLKLPVRGAEFVTKQGNLRRGIPDNIDYSLSQMMKHPDFYKNYPTFKQMPVGREADPDALGSYYPVIKDKRGATMVPQAVTLADMRLSTMRQKLLHELQHGVQAREGFAPGGQPIYTNLNDPSRVLSDFRKYRNLPGEVEARNVELRSLLDPSELQHMYPWETGNLVKMSPLSDPTQVLKALRGGKLETLKELKDYL